MFSYITHTHTHTCACIKVFGNGVLVFVTILSPKNNLISSFVSNKIK
jgi:hypothetical protein